MFCGVQGAVIPIVRSFRLVIIAFPFGSVTNGCFVILRGCSFKETSTENAVFNETV